MTDQVAARDTTFDGVVPKHLWIKISNCDKDGKLRVYFELNGIEKEIFSIVPRYAEKEEGIILQSTNLSWILKDHSKLEATVKYLRELRNIYLNALWKIAKNTDGPEDLFSRQVAMTAIEDGMKLK